MLEVTQIVLLTAALYLVVSTFVFQPFQVELQSMEPTFVGGDHVLVDKLTPRWDGYDRGDVVVFDAPPPFDADGIPYAKRVVGIPGDVVQLLNGRVYVTPEGGVPTRQDEAYLPDSVITLPQGADGRFQWTIPQGTVFVLGDNRDHSVDSRTFGPIGLDRVVGRA